MNTLSYYAVRLRTSGFNEINGFDFGGFIDQMRAERARVIATLPTRAAVWIVLEGRCERDRWRSMGITTTESYLTPVEASASIIERQTEAVS